HRCLSEPAVSGRSMRRPMFVGVGFAVAIVAAAIAVALSVGKLNAAALPIAIGIGWFVLAVAALVLARRLAPRGLGAALVLTLPPTADLPWNHAPNKSTGLPASFYEAPPPDTADPTHALIKSKLPATTAPDRRDPVELVGVSYHWPNL